MATESAGNGGMNGSVARYGTAGGVLVAVLALFAGANAYIDFRCSAVMQPVMTELRELKTEIEALKEYRRQHEAFSTSRSQELGERLSRLEARLKQ